MRMCSNRELGVSNFPISLLVCRDTFACWHCKHEQALKVAPCLIDGHTYRLATNFRDALIPGCESACKLLKISRLKNSGTNGQVRSVNTSQRRLTGDCPIGGGCSTREVKQEPAKKSCNWNPSAAPQPSF
ncbi:hypothetical protein NPIL_557421 [Nephila pilipes]|uniref:Uncharacterized protein n=1 Tax=Nephila pilipes TaxID=299642 RepID=A0A8X6NTS9_NEPPI|nr:hypothetical protein NPIL_266461 [Nephila pilipes]GFT72289.1 hypothetical protein NPIL_557421 [Nephila pilipes]